MPDPRPTLYLAPPTDPAEVLRLVRAGWDVVLDGRRVTISAWDDLLEDEDPSIVWADSGTPYNPAAFGWPEVTRA